MATFVTGATGFVGSHLVARLLAAGEQLELLVRARSNAEASEKLRRALASATVNPASTSGATICLGSLSEAGLGLSARDRDRVLSRCTRFLHAAAHVRFDATLPQARAVNVRGTANLMTLAGERERRGGLERIDYVSTAFVAGHRTDLVAEHELDGRLGHRNAYELTKFEAEAAVRDSARDLPVAIYRPSIIVGEEGTGRTSSFNMIYWPARVYASGAWRICPGRPDAPIDLVPINFVSEAIVALRSRSDSLGRTFHLAAGPRGSMTLGEIAEVLMSVFPGRRSVKFVDPAPWMRYVHPVLKRLTVGSTRRVITAGEVYVPYFERNPMFDNSGAVELLSTHGIRIPSARDYVRRLFDYCLETDWGRCAEARSPSR